MPSPLENDLKRLDHIATFMDSAFRIPGTQVRIGWDPLIGLIPGIGDTFSLLVLFYFLAVGWRHGVAKRVLLLMVGRHLMDALLGSVPVAGDLFDVFYRANEKNLHSIREALAQKAESPKLVS
ncbi:DUF4112 domain-containing protein [Pelagicoccus sp. NFK12]|uniref:DUF4112 domain-containing protein n=1 Tax=Pelagicoccus enzymogenes TaxID=2773457 RepID=A0A927FBW3_9BACT|nr:DUF4112 domain-containing protein [Pelagicoccus enzymogenes]MBD5780875.1 DUF4112 domain-containing protein [Pelagicoccus enzymogenes]MDQ8199914.1 DUF4112 domain-containing protein [Pelagicoccus enzymogenes]